MGRAARFGEYDITPAGPAQTYTRVIKVPQGQTVSA